MPRTPETTKLQNYQDAVSALPLDTQIQKMAAIKTPTLRRFLGADAPNNLILRFSHRLNEVVDDLTANEKARLHVLRGETDEARNLYIQAIQNGDPEGHIGLAEVTSMACNEKDDQIALDQLEKAAEGGADSEKLHLLRANILYINERDSEAAESLKEAAARSNNPEQILNCQRGKEALFQDDINKGLELLLPEAKKGHVPSLSILITKFQQIRETETQENKKHCTENIETFLKMGIQFGITAWYGKLGFSQQENGKRTEEAIESFKRGIAAGDKSLYKFLTVLYLEQDRTEEAKELRDQLLKQGDPEGHIIAAAISGFSQNQKETARHLINALDSGVELPPIFRIFALMMSEKNQLALKECLSQEEKNPIIHICMSEIYKKLGRGKQSKQHMETAFNKAGLKPIIKRAQKLAKRGLNEKAITLISNGCMEAFSDLNMPPEMHQQIVKSIVQRKLNIN